jgi:hypothetical protein
LFQFMRYYLGCLFLRLFSVKYSLSSA